MTETIKMIKAIANDSKVRIDRIVANYEQLEKENAELKERIKEMRCCGNCRHSLEQNPQRCSYCFELCEWELK